jgi:hypothetical protein
MNVKLNILTTKEFETSIRSIMREKSPITMIEAIVMFCQTNNLEIETAASLVTPRMKSVIEGEAIKERLIFTGKARLPIEE